MLEPTRQTLHKAYEPRKRQHIWQWAASDVDFDLVPSYDIPQELSGPYDPDFAPYMKEPVEDLLDPRIREIWFRKPSRFAASESLVLNPIRYIVSVAPGNTLFLSCDEKSTEAFWEDRIKLGLLCSETAAAKVDGAREKDNTYYFDDMILRAIPPRNRGAFKQFGWKYIFVEECSLLPNTAPGMIRKRMDTYQECKAVFNSSPDPQQKRRSSEDPIFYEMDDTDCRKWKMPEPEYRRNKMFEFLLGDGKTPYGLKWDAKAKRKDKTWDLQRVYDSAHYVTPEGTTIINQNRLKIAHTGKWVATNKRGLPWKRGRIANCFISPFRNGDFGEVAVAFLQAKKAGFPQWRTFVYEYLAEEWKLNVDETKASVIYDRQTEYKRGKSFTETPGLVNIFAKRRFVDFLTIDVQKTHLWWLVRRWLEGGDSGLRDWGPIVTWKEVEEIIGRFNPRLRLIDNSYTGRRIEVFDWCLRLKMIPCFGRDSLQMPYQKNMIDPYEGTRKQSRKRIPSYTFNPNILKAGLTQMMRGQSEQHWFVYDNIEYDYVQQVTAEKSVDGLFEKIRNDNHMFDDEVLQYLAACVTGLYRMQPIEKIEKVELSEAQSEAQQEEKKGAKSKRRKAWVDPNSIRL